jgi:DNA repair protein RadC
VQFRQSASAEQRAREMPPASGLIALFAETLADQRRERAVIAGFDSRGCLVGFQEIVGSGCRISNILPPFRAILAETRLAEIVIAHSHPGGPAMASDEDRLTTHRLSALARLAGILLLDHLIFGDEGIYSMSASMLMLESNRKSRRSIPQ